MGDLHNWKITSLRQAEFTDLFIDYTITHYNKMRKVYHGVFKVTDFITQTEIQIDDYQLKVSLLVKKECSHCTINFWILIMIWKS